MFVLVSDDRAVQYASQTTLCKAPQNVEQDITSSYKDWLDSI